MCLGCAELGSASLGRWNVPKQKHACPMSRIYEYDAPDLPPTRVSFYEEDFIFARDMRIRARSRSMNNGGGKADRGSIQRISGGRADEMRRFLTAG